MNNRLTTDRNHFFGKNETANRITIYQRSFERIELNEKIGLHRSPSLASGG